MADEEEGEAEGDGDDEDGMAVSCDGETVWYSVNGTEGSPRKVSDDDRSKSCWAKKSSDDDDGVWKRCPRDGEATSKLKSIVLGSVPDKFFGSALPFEQATSERSAPWVS